MSGRIQIQIDTAVYDRLAAYADSRGMDPGEVVDELFDGSFVEVQVELLDALEQLTRYVTRAGGFMEHRDQQMLRRAKDMLMQHGRQVR